MANAAKYAKASRDFLNLRPKTALLLNKKICFESRAGLPDATRLYGQKVFDSIANDLRTMERAKVGTQSIPVRRRLAAAAGINKTQFDA